MIQCDDEYETPTPSIWHGIAAALVLVFLTPIATKAGERARDSILGRDPDPDSDSDEDS